MGTKKRKAFSGAKVFIKKGKDNYQLKSTFTNNKLPERAKKNADNYAKIFKEYGREVLVKKINKTTYGVYVC